MAKPKVHKDGVEELCRAGKYGWRIWSKGQILDPRQGYSRLIDMRSSMLSAGMALVRHSLKLAALDKPLPRTEFDRKAVRRAAYRIVKDIQG